MVDQEGLDIASHGSMDNIEDILKKLVGFRSYVPYEHEPFEFLTYILEKSNFSVIKQYVSSNRHNLLAERGKGEKAILFYMHLDTVIPAEDYSTPPLTLRKNKGRYLGLGCFDMKGGIAALLSIINLPELQQYKIKLAFCIDEEGLSEGVYKLVNSSFVKDVAVAFCPEACIVPKNWNLPLMFVIGGRGRCVLKIVVPGKTVHGAEDVGGINAIDQAAILVRHLQNWRTKFNLNMGSSSFFVRFIHGDNQGLSIPNAVTIEIDYQLVGKQTPKGLEMELKEFVTKLYAQNVLEKSLQNKFSVQLKDRETPYITPYVVSKRNKYVRIVEALAISMFGKVKFDYTKSVADQNVLANGGIPIITIGPIGGKAHQAGEWVSITSLNTVAIFYRNLFTQHII